MTDISDSELAQGGVDVWFNWLRTALIAYSRDGSVTDRYHAFSPLVVDPQSGSPASDIVQQIRTVRVERHGVVEAAAMEALRQWSLPFDGWEAATLLISVAGRLGGRGVADAIWGVIARSGDLPADARAELAYVAVEVAKLRYKYSEIVSLFELLWSEDLATPNLVASFALLLSRKDHGGLRAMPVKIADIMPALIEPPHSGDFVRTIAASLRKNFSIVDLVAAFRRVDYEGPKIADFRRVLLHLSRGGSSDNVIHADFSQSSRDHMRQRLEALAMFGDGEDISELSFPDAAGSAKSDGPERP